MASDAIESMRREGLEPDLDQIAELIELARRVQEPEHRTWPFLSYEGVRAGTSGHILKPLTIKSGRWHDFIVDKISDYWQIYACAYAMEFGHDESADFVSLYDLERAQSALAGYAATLSCNPEELREAIERCMDIPTDGDRYRAKRNPRGEVNTESIIAELVAVTGQPEEYWLSRTSTFAMEVLKHAVNHSAAMFGGVDYDQSDLVKAEFDFACCVDRIERELKGEESFIDG